MNPEHWQRVEALYYEALDLPAEQRAAFLDRACAGDAALRREVESLLAAHSAAGAFLAAPAIEEAAQRLRRSLSPKDQTTAQLSSSALLSLGSSLNQYQLIAHLGAGGMGEVYLAEDTRLHRKVALKLLPAQFAQNADRVRRFEQEARAVSALNHPNIVTLFDLGQVEQHYFMTTEFIDGQTLRAHLQEHGQLPVREASEITLQIAGALAAAHAAGIVHRDIKPENVMLRHDGIVKVLDFGLAKFNEQLTAEGDTNDAPSSITEAGAVLGTVSYMSPEQARGLRVDARTDSFSLGVVLYEMLTGKRPFTGSTASDIIASILRSDPPPLTEVLAEAPAELQTLIAKALAKERDERYQTASAFARDLKQLSQDLEFQARLADSGRRRTDETAAATSASAQPGAPATVATGPSLSTKRKLLSLAAAGLGVLLLVAGLWQFGKLRAASGNRAAKESPAAVKTLAVLPFKFIGSVREDEYLGLGIADALISKLSRLRQLTVRPTQSVLRYQNSEVSPQEAGRALKADAVLTGIVQKVGEKVRLSFQLVPIVTDGEAEQNLWSGEFNERADDLFALQDALSAQLLRALSLQLTSEEQQRLQQRYTDNAQAYQLYLRSRFFFGQKSKEGTLKAEELLQQALALDNRYALAYAELANVMLQKGDLAMVSQNELRQKTEELLNQALALDDSLADAHASLGIIYQATYFDWPRAEREFVRALALDPKQPMARQWYGVFLLSLGRVAEGISESRLAVELDPLSVFMRSQLARALYLGRKYDEAIAVCRELIQEDANHAPAYLFLGQAYDLKGDFNQAIAALTKAVSLSSSPERAASLAHAYARTGRRAEALQKLNELKNPNMGWGDYYIATIYTALDDREAAFAALELAYQHRDPGMANRVKIDPKLDPLRTDPRFSELLGRLGL